LQLGDHFRVVAWDAPGAGPSSDPPDAFTTKDYVHCLARFLDGLSDRNDGRLHLGMVDDITPEYMDALNQAPQVPA
jgi:pimeloyl-ACP methyl ester carboxylesterase